MSDFLGSLVSRTLAPAPAIRPRLPSPFEAPTPAVDPLDQVAIEPERPDDGDWSTPVEREVASVWPAHDSHDVRDVPQPSRRPGRRAARAPAPPNGSPVAAFRARRRDRSGAAPERSVAVGCRAAP